MTIWKRPVDPAIFAAMTRDTLAGLLGIELLEAGADYLRAAMPVDKRHVQPFGVLHGGGNVVLAETVGSVAGNLASPPGWSVVGVEVNANHLAPAPLGDRVEAMCRPLQLGRSLQVWQIEIRRGDGRLTCVSRLTTAVRPPRE